MTVGDRTSPIQPIVRTGAITVAVVFAAITLRSPIAAVAPLAHDIESALGISPTTVGLLSSLPVLCFGLLAALGVVASDRIGADLTFTIFLIGTMIGAVVRSSGGVATAVIGTVLIGLFLAIGNVVVPVVIAKEYSPARASQMAGVYSAMFTVGATTVTFAGAPLAVLVGWRTALAAFLVFALVALVAWGTAKRGRAFALDIGRAQAPTGGTRTVLRATSTWLLAAAFAAQTFSYYGTSAWLPSLLSSFGFSAIVAGSIAGIFQAAGIVGAIGMPIFMRRFGQVSGVVLVVALWLTVPVGFLLAPQLWVFWCVLGGLGQGGGIASLFIMIVSHSRSERETAARSGVVQGIGYTVAATGSVVIGATHDATGGWSVPLLVLSVSVLTYGAFGVLAAVTAGRR